MLTNIGSKSAIFLRADQESWTPGDQDQLNNSNPEFQLRVSILSKEPLVVLPGHYQKS